MAVFAGVSLLAGPLLAACNAAETPQERSDVQVAFVEPAYVEPEVVPPPEPAWDEKSDCAPGAPPNSLANALDVLKVHCDREEAYRKLGGLAAVAVLARFGGGGAAVARGAGAAGAAAEIGTAARTVAAGARIGSIAAQASDHASEIDEPAEAAAQPAQSDGQYPVSVTDIGEGSYEITLSDGATYQTDAEGARAAFGN